MSRRFDAIVIGAGHNGLVAANYLALAGLEVLVLERRPIVGGACVTEELIPGTRSSSCAFVAGPGLHPRVARELELRRFGLDMYQTDVLACVVSRVGGSPLVLWGDIDRTLREVRARYGIREASGYVQLGARLRRFAALMRPFLLEPPPSLDHVRERFARHADLLREFTELSIAELLDRYLRADELRGMMAFLGLTGTHGGPSTPGTAFVFAYHSWGEFEGRFGELAFPRGGMGAISEALAGSARARGVTLLTDMEVERIVVRDGVAAGVACKDGREFESSLLLSNADPRRTFLSLVHPAEVDAGFLSELRSLDFRGSMARVHIAVDELPPLTEERHGPEYRGVTMLGSTMEALERCGQAQERRELPDVPLPLEFLTQSAHDSTLRDGGRHVIVAGLQQLPFEPARGSWDELAPELTERVVDSMCAYVPSLRQHIVATGTITPLDLERTYGLTGGNLFHGAMTLEQIFDRRPLPGYGDYRTPVQGLFLCGAGTHPGGAVTGMPGHNAAKRALAHLGRAGGRRSGPRPGQVARRVRTSAVDRLLERPVVRRLVVKAASRPRLGRLLGRVGQ